jgi:hypothetical protein
MSNLLEGLLKAKELFDAMNVPLEGRKVLLTRRQQKSLPTKGYIYGIKIVTKD